MPFVRLAVAVLCATPSVLFAQGKNLLFYGNSFSFFNGGVAQLVRGIAIEAGLPAPTYQEQLVAGEDLHFHATDPTQVAAITTSLPPGQHWDVVVMQGLSTEATAVLGHPSLFVSSAIQILSNVRSHSPACTGVLYQTWARGQGHSFYPTYFQNPLAMHHEVRANYRNAVPAIEAVHGAGSVVVAAAGDCAALYEFDPSIYFVDLQHPANALTVMASMCLFTAIYGRPCATITPNWNPPGPLATRLTQYGMNLTDWQRYAGIADLGARRAMRPYPGSGDQLLLEAGTPPGLVSAWPRHALTAGNTAQIRLSSRNGVFANAPAWLVADLFPTGQPPAPYAAYPELAVDVGGFAVLATAPDLSAPLSLTVPLSFSLLGVSVLVQGIAWQPSAETGNPWFATTDGHEFLFY